MDKISLDIPNNRFPVDLLQRFMGRIGDCDAVKEKGDEIELNLGLSLGGKFGVDKSPNSLVRSSSIASCLPQIRDDNETTPCTTGLVRTSSLPAESEVEWRKRKELQTLRRMEAKRRRFEKLKNLKPENNGGGSLNLDKEKPLPTIKRQTSSLIGSQFRLSELENLVTPLMKGKGECVETSVGVQAKSQELDNTTEQGSSSATKASEESKNNSNSPSKKTSDLSRVQGRETRVKAIEDMPSVFTKGNGPNGRRVDGILYKYGRGEEVRIMCVCHGSFHSSAEFVKHAGGTDVDQPLRHIVINPHASSLW